MKKYSIKGFCNNFKMTKSAFGRMIGVDPQRITNMEKSEDFNFIVHYFEEDRRVTVARKRKVLDCKEIYSGSTKKFISDFKG